jgi:hypothetical protein
VECVFTNTFVPGESQAVGGIMGLIDGPDGAPAAAGIQPGGNGAGWWAAIALIAAAFASITGLTAGVRRLARVARRA